MSVSEGVADPVLMVTHDIRFRNSIKTNSYFGAFVVFVCFLSLSAVLIALFSSTF